MQPMTPPRFVHLRLHSEYSVTDGIVRLADAVKRAAGDGMPALALTDLGNLFGLVKFYSAARGKGVKPLAGADVWIANPAAPESASRLLLLVRNREGYRQRRPEERGQGRPGQIQPEAGWREHQRRLPRLTSR